MSRAIVQLLHSKCVLLNCTYENSEDVIRALGSKLLQAGFVKESFIQAALEREKNLPTGLPLAGGINAAIPHTEIEHVLKPALAMAILSREVKFKNMVSPQEQVPVRLVFLLALEKPKAQIEMLQEIAGVLQNPDLVKRLLAMTSFQEVVDALGES